MTTHPPSTSALGHSSSDTSPNQQAQVEPHILNESEAMRRIQDLLTAKKLSINDTIIFEYNNHSFNAQIMSDGSLKANPHMSSSDNNDAAPALKLYSSPSEFASDMAARVALLDEKGMRHRGKISTNGWNTCTVNGRTLATIRNEMLHERKNENAGISKSGRVKDSRRRHASTRLERGSKESLAKLDVFAKDKPAADESTPIVPLAVQEGPDHPRAACHSEAEIEKPKILARGEAHATSQPIPYIAATDTDTTRNADSKAQSELAPSSRQSSECEITHNVTAGKNEVDTHETLDQMGLSAHDRSFTIQEQVSDEKNFIDLGVDKDKGLKSSLDGVTQAGSPQQVSGQAEKDPPGMMELNSAQCPDKIRTGSKNKKSEEAESTLHEMSTKGGAQYSDLGQSLTEEGKLSLAAEQKIDVEGTAVGSSGIPSTCREREESGQEKSDDCEDVESRAEDDPNDNKSDAEEQQHSAGTREDVQEMSSDENEVAGNVEPPVKPEGSDEGEQVTGRKEPGLSRFLSLKGVSDLQQEILGHSDSDEDSFAEADKKPGGVTRKRSRSPSNVTKRKRKRKDDCGSPLPEQETLTERPVRKTSKGRGTRGSTMDEKMSAEIDDAQLDPETMEAAAIAAQIEKEEANNRARRTTRLAAGKIKQVDYKSSAVTHTPRSISPANGSEENDRDSNDNESPPDTSRTTRRKTTQQQVYLPQRSSRRVAKLRTGQEKDQSSNDDMESSVVRSSSGGNGIDFRTDGETVMHLEDTDPSKGHGARLNGTKVDISDRRRSRLDTAVRRARHSLSEEGDHDSVGRAYSTRASTRENSVGDAAEITDLGDPNDFPSDCEGVGDDNDIHKRTDGHGFTISDIKCIAKAVRTAESTDLSDVLRALGDQEGWKSEGVRNEKVEQFFCGTVDTIENLSSFLSHSSERVTTDQILSSLSIEVWRLTTGGLNTGLPRKSSAVLRKALREDQMRSSVERSRRKEHRDVEEMRATLEREMEFRRRAELDALYTEIQVSEATRALSRDKARCLRADQELQKYRRMESDVRKRLEKAKILVGQLRGEKDDTDDLNGHEKQSFDQEETVRSEPRPNGSFASSPVPATRNSTSSDDDVEMTDKNITTTSQRLLEMDRLRLLIAAREAEAEEFQRICEKERMRFVNTLELKNRLETEVYLYRSHGSATLGAANTSALPLANRIGKESAKKGEHKGHFVYGNRGPGYAKQRGSVAKGIGLFPGGPNQKSITPISKSKQGPGKAGEVLKAAKRKPTPKTNGNGSDKV